MSYNVTAKLTAAALALVAVMLTIELWQLALWVILFFGLACFAGVFPVALKRLLPFLYIVLFMILIHGLVSPLNSTYWWYWGREGLEYAGRTGMRLICMVLLSNLVLLTTNSYELIRQMGRLHPDLGIIFGLLLSVLPVMRRQMQTTLDVQATRGLDYRNRLPGRLLAYIAVIVPVIIQSINRAYYMAQLLYLRGYRGQRTAFSDTWNQADWWLFSVSCLSLILIIYVRCI